MEFCLLPDNPSDSHPHPRVLMNCRAFLLRSTEASPTRRPIALHQNSARTTCYLLALLPVQPRTSRRSIVDMRAFDEEMAASSSSVSSKPKRERDSPPKKALLGTKVRILSLRKGAFLLSSMDDPGAISYRGVRKMQSSLPFASRSIRFFGA